MLMCSWLYISAPGGFIIEDPDQTRVSRTDICVFGCEGDRDKLKQYFDVSYTDTLFVYTHNHHYICVKSGTGWCINVPV